MEVSVSEMLFDCFKCTVCYNGCYNFFICNYRILVPIFIFALTCLYLIVVY